MYKGKKILGVITARGGSKGIPKKNIKDLAGLPLIAYTIEAAKNSRLLTRTIVSTDSDEIAEISKQHGGEVPFLRPAELAEDKSSSIDTVKHAILKLEEAGEKYDYIMILQPTSPLRSAEDIDRSIEIAVSNDADSVMSMMEVPDFSAKKIKKLEENGVIRPYFEDEGKASSMRQELSKAYKRNCAIYLTRKDLVMNDDLFGKKSLAYLMPRERSIDINEPIDFEMAKFWVEKYNKGL